MSTNTNTNDLADPNAASAYWASLHPDVPRHPPTVPTVELTAWLAARGMMDQFQHVPSAQLLAAMTAASGLTEHRCRTILTELRDAGDLRPSRWGRDVHYQMVVRDTPSRLKCFDWQAPTPTLAPRLYPAWQAALDALKYGQWLRGTVLTRFMLAASDIHPKSCENLLRNAVRTGRLDGQRSRRGKWTYRLPLDRPGLDV